MSYTILGDLWVDLIVLIAAVNVALPIIVLAVAVVWILINGPAGRKD